MFDATSHFHPASGSEEENPHQALVVNFEIGKTYDWKVSCQQADGKVITSEMGHFRTGPHPPRRLNIPNNSNIGNIRDLGGRKGLDGWMIH